MKSQFNFSVNGEFFHRSKQAEQFPNNPPEPFLPPWANEARGVREKDNFSLPEDEYEHILREFETRGEAVSVG